MIIWLAFCGTALGLFLVVPLLGRSRAQGYDFWLGLFLLSLVLVLMVNVLPAGAAVSLPLLCAVAVTPQAALAPLMYQVVRRAAGHRFRRWELWHFLPLGLFGILHFSSAVLTMVGLAEGVQGTSWLNGILVMVAGVYLLFGYRSLVEVHRRGLETGNSGIQAAGRSVLWLVVSATGLWLGWLASTLSPVPFTKELAQAGILVFFYLVGWLRWRGESATPGIVKYANSGMTAQTETLVADRVVRVVERDKAFLDEELTLDKVAQKVGCSPHWVSQYLNGTRGMTFFDYVNGLRVDEFVRLARESATRHRSILDLSLAAGFRNKSTFNGAFKKKLGLTPRDWRRARGKDATIGAVEPSTK